MKKNIIGFLVFIILFIVGLQKISFILSDKFSYNMYYDFYHDNTEYDILFAGASHSRNSIFPMDLYADYGIKSYNIANANETIPMTYWTIKTAIKTHKPKIIVLEVFFDGWGNKIMPESINFMYTYYNTLPFSKDKLDAYFDILDDEHRMQFLFPLSLFHYRWENLSEVDFNPEPLSDNGAEFIYNVKWFDYKYDDSLDKYDFVLRPISREYMDKIKKLCDENNIKLVIFQSPFCVEDPEHKTAIGYRTYAKQNNIPYFSLLGTDKINYALDMGDTGHTNIIGARRITKMMGDYLIENFGDMLDTSRTSFWDKKLEKSNANWKNSIYYLNQLDEIITIGIARYKVKIYFGKDASSIKYNHLIKTIIDSKEVEVGKEKNCPTELCVEVYEDDECLVTYYYDDFGQRVIKE